MEKPEFHFRALMRWFTVSRGLRLSTRGLLLGPLHQHPGFFDEVAAFNQAVLEIASGGVHVFVLLVFSGNLAHLVNALSDVV